MSRKRYVCRNQSVELVQPRAQRLAQPSAVEFGGGSSGLPNRGQLLAQSARLSIEFSEALEEARRRYALFREREEVQLLRLDQA